MSSPISSPSFILTATYHSLKLAYYVPTECIYELEFTVKIGLPEDGLAENRIIRRIKM